MKKMLKPRIKLEEDGKLPAKATKGAAAYDVFIPTNTAIFPGRQIVPLNFRIELPYGYEAKIEPRSGFSSKGMQSLAGDRVDADVLVGKIDSDYRGVVGVIIHSREEWPFALKEGERIAQMTIYKVEDAEFEVADNLSETDRGEGGFGSTN